MKFKIGHWMVKPFVRPLYAAECFRARREGDEVELLLPGQKGERAAGHDGTRADGEAFVTHGGRDPGGHRPSRGGGPEVAGL